MLKYANKVQVLEMPVICMYVYYPVLLYLVFPFESDTELFERRKKAVNMKHPPNPTGLSSDHKQSKITPPSTPTLQ